MDVGIARRRIHRACQSPEVHPRKDRPPHEQARMEQAELLAQHFRRSSALPEAVTPASLAAALTGLARTIVNEQSIGITAAMTVCAHW
jgi:hypothetical protein